VYGVVTLELIVRSLPLSKKRKAYSRRLQVYRNRSIIQPGENAWGFGQIIAIILTFGNFIDIWVAVREWRAKNQISPKEGGA
jgi:hypothetical protein